MIKKITAVICTFLLSAALCGCQLAKADASEEHTQDRLIGVYITTEYLDLYDWESHLEDNAFTLTDGGDIAGTDDYSLKVYAEAKITTERGIPTAAYSFDGIEGIAFFSATVYGTDGQNNYESLIAGNEVSNVYSSYNCTDEADSVSIEGTLYFDPSKDLIFHLNPVYETEDGQVYLASGGPGVSGSGWGTTTQTLTETHTTASDAKTVTEGFTITVHFEPKNSTQKIVVKQMDDSDTVISSTVITKDNIPESIEKKSGAAYIIVEDHGLNYSGEEEITRKLIETGDTALPCYFMGDNGIAEASYIELK